MLINGQHFFLMYDPRSWTAQIEGKKYYLIELRDAELAAESLSRVLRYGTIENKPSPKKAKDTEEPTPPQEDTPEEIQLDEPEEENPEV